MGCFWPSKRREPHKLTQHGEQWQAANGAGRPGRPANQQHSVSSSSSTTSNSSIRGDTLSALQSTGLSALPAHCRRFRYHELDAATNGFHADNVVGEGGFGKVYKGKLPDGTSIAIKRLDRSGMQGDKEFAMEVNMLGSLAHENIISLRGVCVEGEHCCTIFDLASNGSLRGQLDLGAQGLGWPARTHVALGAARGLQYLHDVAEPPVVHRDFKTSNILVDAAGNARVADFGLARRMKSRGGAGCHEALPPECTVVMGTFGYVAPEYARTGTLNEKSDVYAFGVVLLELLTGAEVVDAQRPLANRNLVDWLYSKLHDIEQIQGELDECLGEIPDAELATFCELAAACLQQDAYRRPCMSDAVTVLQQICACHSGDASVRAQHPATPPQSAPNSRPPSRVTPTSSGEAHNAGRKDSSGGGPPAPAGSSSSPVAFRSLSHEATIVCLDGGSTADAQAVRDPFAASFNGFQASSAIPKQQGYSMAGTGANPFAGLSNVAEDSDAAGGGDERPADGSAQRPPLPRIATSRAEGPKGSHSRTGSFSDSLDQLAAKLGLSAIIGPNGQPVFASQSAAAAAAAAPQQQPQQQQQQSQRQPPQAVNRQWTSNNLSWNLPAESGNQSQELQQSVQNPLQSAASAQYINSMAASGGNAFVSSTSEWRRRNLSPAAPQLLAATADSQPVVPLLASRLPRPHFAAPPQGAAPMPALLQPHQLPYELQHFLPRASPPTSPAVALAGYPLAVRPPPPPPLQQQQQQPGALPWHQRQNPFRPQNPFSASPTSGSPGGAYSPHSNPFHSSEPCMVCGDSMREWHLAPCGHAIGCKPCVLQIARIGQTCPVCLVPATGMLHQRFVHAAPVAAPGGAPNHI